MRIAHADACESEALGADRDGLKKELRNPEPAGKGLWPKGCLSHCDGHGTGDPLSVHMKLDMDEAALRLDRA